MLARSLRSATMRVPMARAATPLRNFSVARAAFETSKSEQKLVETEPATTSDIEEFEILSGAPADLTTKRTVRIYKESRPATQSGTWGTGVWRLDWDIVGRANRWENDLMGWASSGDYMQATQIKFRTKEDAVRFALNQGWNSVVHESNKRDFKVKVYADNFFHSSSTLKHIRTK